VVPFVHRSNPNSVGLGGTGAGGSTTGVGAGVGVGRALAESSAEFILSAIEISFAFEEEVGARSLDAAAFVGESSFFVRSVD